MTSDTSTKRKTPRTRASVQQGDVLDAAGLRAIRSEAEFQREVQDLLNLGKWLWHHEVDSRKSKRGLPDLIAVRHGRLIFAELKSSRGKVSDEQAAWLYRLGCLDGRTVETYVWRPSDMDEIKRILA